MLTMAACAPAEKPVAEDDPNQKLLQAKPEKSDEYRALMAKNLANYEYMTLGFMNFDMGKVKMAADNMRAISGYLSQNIPPAYQSRSEDWKAYCEELGKNAAEVAQKSQDKDYDGLRSSFQNIMKTCMECHILYRKHLLTSKF